MTVNYTTSLALGQPVTGTESGTWGDDVNNAVTSYLDIAIAGGLAVTVTTADVTLTLTQGTSVATNIGSTTAQYSILNVSGAMTAARNLIVPSSSRQYVINNNTTGGFLLTVKGSATTGVTLVNGEKTHVFWNGSDYAKLSNTPGGAGTFSSITNTGLTSGRVVFSTTGGLETDSANLTFSGSALAVTGTLSATGAVTFTGTTATLSGTGLGASNNILSVGNSTDSDAQLRLRPNSAERSWSIGASTLAASTLTITPSTTNGGSTFTTPVISISSTGLAVTGTLSATGTLSGGTSGTGYSFSGSAPAGSLALDSSGNLGVGTTSPNSDTRAEFTKTENTAYTTSSGGNLITLRNNSTTAGVYAGIQFIAVGNGADVGTAQINAVQTASGSAALAFGTRNSATTAEKMRLDSSGNLLVGQTSTGLRNSNSLSLEPSASGAAFVNHANGSSSGNGYIFFGYNGSAIGSITQSGTTAVLYNTTSDQRLKENIVDAPEFGSVIDSIKVRSYDWKTDQTHQRAGFIAQELVTVAPEAVHQPTDPEAMMAVDYSKLVPMLVKEIQSLRKRLADAGIA